MTERPGRKARSSGPPNGAGRLPRALASGMRSVGQPLRKAARTANWRVTVWRYGLFGLPTGARRLNWVFLATLPNGGSTALAKLVETSPDVRLLTGNGEGQWLLPDLVREGGRWDADNEVDYRRVRAVWLRQALRLGKPPFTIFEKSPPNLVRMGRLISLFDDHAHVDLVVMSRDPVAVCASWAKRYPPEYLARNWMTPDDVPRLRDEAVFYRTLGDLCGARMGYLAGLRDRAALCLRYEDMTADPESSIRALLQAVPSLGAIDAQHSVAVKDYGAQPLRNMNAEQRARLTGRQLGWVLEGLAPHEANLRRFSYRLA